MDKKLRFLNSAKKRVHGLAIISLALVILIGGCNPYTSSPNNAGGDLTAPEKKERLTLYFSDKEAMFLIPEEREVIVPPDKSLAFVALEELIKGPQNPELAITLPKETQIRSITVENAIATVDFTMEFQTKHWGGSTGEIMTLYSVTNTLARLPGIEQVQFLLEGEKQETILGHMENTEPLSPNWDLNK